MTNKGDLKGMNSLMWACSQGIIYLLFHELLFIFYYCLGHLEIVKLLLHVIIKISLLFVT